MYLIYQDDKDKKLSVFHKYNKYAIIEDEDDE